jgi:hypothetical protein
VRRFENSDDSSGWDSQETLEVTSPPLFRARVSQRLRRLLKGPEDWVQRRVNEVRWPVRERDRQRVRKLRRNLIYTESGRQTVLMLEERAGYWARKEHARVDLVWIYDPIWC